MPVLCNSVSVEYSSDSLTSNRQPSTTLNLFYCAKSFLTFVTTSCVVGWKVALHYVGRELCLMAVASNCSLYIWFETELSILRITTKQTKCRYNCADPIHTHAYNQALQIILFFLCHHKFSQTSVLIQIPSFAIIYLYLFQKDWRRNKR